MSDGTPLEPDLSAARAEVLASVAGSPMSRNRPQARAEAPLRPLPPELEAKLAADVDRLPVPAGAETSLARVVVPSAVLAVLDAAGVVAGLASGHYLLAVVAGLLFVPLAAIAVIGAGLLRRDPLRLTGPERRALAAASRWDSNLPWSGPLEFCTERGLVIAAARVAERIARSPGWRSSVMASQRVRLDLGAELDQIDEQAHRVAVARHQPGAVPGAGAPAVERAWDIAVNRVAALVAFADNLDEAAAVGRDEPVRDTDLLAGSALDELAMERLAALTVYLDATRGEPFG